MYPNSGFLCLTAGELSNLAVLIREGGLSTIDARVYLAAVESVERREIAKRVRAKLGRKAAGPTRRELKPRYGVQELATITQEPSIPRLKRSLKRLANSGLLRFEASRIETTRCGLFPEDPLCRELKRRGSLSRLVPIPRRLFARTLPGDRSAPCS